MTNIHSTAIIAPDAKIGKDVEIGPFCIIGNNVEIGDNCRLVSNVIVDGNTTIGKNNIFYHSSVIGTAPQDLKYRGEVTRLIIGDNNTVREFATINRSATMDEPTRVGNNNLLMTYSHIAHNCQLGNGIILANSVNLAGHIHIDDFVTIGGITAVHQFVKIGKFAFIGGASGVKKDVPPFTRGEGMPYIVSGLNSVGLQRRGFAEEIIRSVKQIYRIFYRSGLNTAQALAEADKLNDLNVEQKMFIEFVRNSERGITKD
ncbi:MAG: acyl-ACP--UDP-N-acetylglucosamine O-acyltransferase [Candidatus Cloacimonetes bacterium]|nr:acyl-ACP--UDP-N-acetylglucosamine O-acyltransferase [Candidatus Cloacimonadota bacterium]